MLKFTLHNVSVHVDGSDEELSMLHAHLKIPVKDRYFIIRRARYSGWDGTVQFLNLKTRRFSVGLWPHVKRWLKLNGHEFTVFLAKRKPLAIKPTVDCLRGIILRADQLDAINRWLNNHGVGLIWCPAGSGKTEMACCAIKLLSDYRLTRKVLFVANGLDLVNQAISRIKDRLGINAGRIGSGVFNTSPPIIVASIQTLDSILKRRVDRRHNELRLLLEVVDFLVFDEVHHSRSNQTKRLMKSAVSLRFKLGLSAQPFHKYDENNLSVMTAEDVSVLASMGPVVARVKSSDLIKQGRLAKPTLFIFPVQAKEELTWNESRKLHLFENKTIYNIVGRCVRLASRAGVASLVIAGSSRKFGRSLLSAINEQGVEAVNLHGNISDSVRERFRSQMNKGKLHCIVATTIYDEGVDLPNIKQLVLANGGLSPIKIEQRIGRGLRKKSFGSNAVVIVDFMFYGNRYLRRHSLARLRRYIAEEAYEIKLVGPAEKHSPYVRKLIDGRGEIGLLPDEDTFRRIYGNDNSRVSGVATTKVG